MTNYKIDIDIPVPHRGYKYPFSDMKIGHSFWVPAPEVKRAQNAAFMRARDKGEGYVSRKEGDGQRIWRIA